MKWIYISIMLVIAVFTLGCVDKNQAETTTPAQPALPGESAVAPSEVTPEAGEDIFGTYSDLNALDNLSSDLDMQIVLSTDI